MKYKGFFWLVAACAIAVFAFAFAVYRAKTQAIAHDEALTYLWYLDGGVGQIFKFDPNNHILLTLLAKPIVKTFGPSELALRTPSLLGAAIYLVFALLLCFRLFGASLLLVLGTGLLALNPLVVDFASAARGYGLGLAFLMVAMYFFARAIDRDDFPIQSSDWCRDSLLASSCLGLSFASSLTNFVPAVALIVTFGVVTIWTSQAAKAGESQVCPKKFLRWAVAPGVGVGLFITWPFLLQARPIQFSIGYASAADSLRDLFNASFLYRWTDDFFLNLGGQPPVTGSWQKLASDVVIRPIAPLLFLYVVFGVFYFRKKLRDSVTDETSRLSEFFCLGSVGCVVLLAMLHFGARMKYPVSRVCVYLIPLFTVAYLSVVRIWSHIPSRASRVARIVVAVVVLYDYAVSLQARSLRYNAYDAESRNAFLAIQGDGLRRGLTSANIGGTWWYEPEMEFYRRKYHANWLAPYDVKDPSYPFQTQNKLAPPDYDYFLYTPENDPRLSGSENRSIFYDAKTGIRIIAIAKR